MSKTATSMKHKNLLKAYYYNLLGLLLFSYGFMMDRASEMEIIEVEFDLYFAIAAVGIAFAYEHKMAILKEGRKNIFYSLFVILLVFLMHYWFCVQNDCLYMEDVASFFLTLYLVIAYELFDLLFYKDIIDDGKKKSVKRTIKLQTPKEHENALEYFSEILEIDHLYHFNNLEKEQEIESFKEREEGWLFYESQDNELEFDYRIELITYMEYTTLWTRLLQASREGFKIYIEDEKSDSYDIIESGRVLSYLTKVDK